MKKMNLEESSFQILLAEYERLQKIEEYFIHTYSQSQQFLLTVISVASGTIIYLLQTQQSLDSLRLSIMLVLATVLMLGEITFVKLVGDDIGLMKLSKRYQIIRDKFIENDKQLKDTFPDGLIKSTPKFQSFASIRSVISRVFQVSGAKTIVTIINTIIFVSLIILLVLPNLFWDTVIIGVIASVLYAFFHVIYASWRYKKVPDQLADGVIAWWM